MASLIKIKRSSVSGNPAVLSAGELAYSALTDNGSNGGDRLYIGIGTETNGNAANHFVIGGKYFTDLLDHNKGTLTANSALLVDSNSKIDRIKVGNVDVSSNTITTLDTNGNLIFNPNGTGKVSFYNAYTFPRSDGTAGQALITNGNGTVSFTSISTTMNIAGDTGTDTVSLINDTLSFNGGTGVTVAVSDNLVTINLDNASTTDKGIASFSSNDFTVTNGLVTLKTGAIQDIVGDMVSSNTESGISVIYTPDGKLNFDVANFTLTVTGDVDGAVTITDLSNSTLSLILDTVNANVGTFGSATSVPVFTVNGKGLITGVSTASISTSFTITGTTGTETFNNGETLSFIGSNGITTAVTNNTVTISAANATTTVKGIASFDTNNFTVTSGAVSLKTGSVSNTQLENSSIIIGSSTISLGSTISSLSGIQQLDVDNITINGNEISSTNVNGDISLNPNGTGTVDVNDSRITSLATPTQASDAATKSYVDSVASGLEVKESVRATTVTNITLSGVQTIDDVALSVGDRVLVKNQSNSVQNGIYIVSNTGWTRAADFNGVGQSGAVSGGAFAFVEEGTIYGDTGWVLTNDGLVSIGSDSLTFTQFSGAGSISPGAGLSKTGDRLDVLVASEGGIEISADSLQLKSSIAGDGLTYTSGVINVVGTSNRISVSSNAVDISTSYAGQSSITTLGTITTGIWNGSAISVSYGGTGSSSFTSNGILFGNGTGSIQSTSAGLDGYFLYSNDGTPAWTNVIDGGTY
jgi:hypothetical protein